MWLGGTSHDTCWSVVLASSINCDHDSRSSCALMLREAHHTAAAGAAARAKAASICFSDNPSRLGEALPSDWRWLREKHGCKAFARVPVVVAGEPVGCLSLAAKGAALRLGVRSGCSPASREPNKSYDTQLRPHARGSSLPDATSSVTLVPRGSSLLACRFSCLAGRVPCSCNS